MVDSINADKEPAVNRFWAAQEVGWYYTPAFDYGLTGIDTRFGTNLSVPSNYDRTVTLELYSAHPEAGGVLLRSARFTPAEDSFSGASFAYLWLTGGSTYFIGFRNVGNLGVNYTADPTARNLGVVRAGVSNLGIYDQSETGNTAQPILRFHGSREPMPHVIPELPAPALAALAALPLALVLRRRRK